MRLFDLALRNIKSNFKKYVMFFFSLNFSVFTVYTFLALMQNEQVNAAFTYDGRYRALLLTFGVIIMVFVLFFLISSNNSFIRARKKEISTYALFGMTNRRIGKLIFLETMMVGLTSLAVGIGAGIFFSKLMAMFLLDISLAGFTGNISFSIGVQAIYITLLIFITIFSLMGLSGLWVINKFELVELFRADKKSEGRSQGSYVILLLSLLLMGTGYYFAYLGDPFELVVMAIPILLLVVLGTYLFFWGGLPKVLSLMKRNKQRYYQGVNLISTSSFSHRMKSIGSVMATIAVLSAVATTAIATGFTLYRNMENNAYDMVGYDLYYYDGEEANLLEGVEDVFKKHGISPAYHHVPLYRGYPEVGEINYENITYYNQDDYFRIYSESMYNELVTFSKSRLKPVEVQAGEAKYLLRFKNDDFENAMKEQLLDFNDFAVEISEIIYVKFLHLGSHHALVLNDDDFARLLNNEKMVKERGQGHFFTFDDSFENKALNDELHQILSQAGGYQTIHDHYSNSRETFGLICFIGFFMSAVFILMTASLLYFKQVMAAEEERNQYETLRKIGMNHQVEKRVIAKRLSPVFAVPMVMGVIHSIFAMKTADTMVFSNMIDAGNSYLTVLTFSAMMYVAYGVVYAIFYFITKGQYTKIVRS